MQWYIKNGKYNVHCAYILCMKLQKREERISPWEKGQLIIIFDISLIFYFFVKHCPMCFSHLIPSMSLEDIDYAFADGDKETEEVK